jgi:flavodoxin
MSGNTAQTAERIASILGAELIRIEPVKEYHKEGMKKFVWGGMSAVMGETPRLHPYRFDADYDRVIIGTPVWASNIAPPIRSFIKQNRDNLRGKVNAAFFCYAGGGADKASAKLRKLLSLDSFDAELVLIDPKDKPKPEDDAAIVSFCKQLK